MPGCKWQEAWRSKFPWIAPVAGQPSKVCCTACEKELSCDRGTYDLMKHNKNVRHAANVEKKKTESKKGMKVQTISESLKNAEKVSSEERKVKDAALKAEAGRQRRTRKN